MFLEHTHCRSYWDVSGALCSGLQLAPTRFFLSYGGQGEHENVGSNTKTLRIVASLNVSVGLGIPLLVDDIYPTTVQMFI